MYPSDPFELVASALKFLVIGLLLENIVKYNWFKINLVSSPYYTEHFATFHLHAVFKVLNRKGGFSVGCKHSDKSADA